MDKGALTEQLDVALLVFNLFFIFFLGLIAYLHRESKREGYPLVNNLHQPVGGGLFGMPAPKTYALADGTSMSAPHDRDSQMPVIGSEDLTIPANAPLVPILSPMLEGIGPGAYANRRDIPDVTYEGKNRLVPMRLAEWFSIAPRDPDPRGMPVYGADDKLAGTVTDAWVDLSETTIRYLEVDIGTGSHVLLPINMADINKGQGQIVVDAILAGQFVQVPRQKSADRVTLLEEERIMGYYGAGYLYATPARQEPLI